MPDENAGASDADFIADFIRENKNAPAEPVADATAASDAGDEASDETPADPAATDDVAEPADDADDGDGQAKDDETDAPVPSALDVKALDAAIQTGDPSKVFEVLGDELSEKLFGSSAHKALRHTSKEIRQSRENLVKAEAALKAKFGDPAAARAAAAKGPEGADEFVATVERFFGASWADCVKYVNASFAGKPARLEAKAAAQKAADTEQQKKVAEAKEKITASVKKTDAALLEAYPGLTDAVFEKMRAEFQKGRDMTTAKALAAVKTDLQAQHMALSKVFSTKPPAPPKTQLRPPRETGKTGAPMTDEEFIKSFIREQRGSR